jgi:2,4-dienoyl-CoA reductase-like NADH-dependent reductase (Old Yellow Enzyme family)
VLTASGQWTPGSQEVLATIAEKLHEQGSVALMQLACGADRETDIGVFSTEAVKAKQDEMLAAANKAYELGFDGVEYHCAHGFFLSRFLNDLNTRTDEFGGSTQNKARIVTDIIPAIRQSTGEDFIVGVRMGAYLPTLEEGLAIAKTFEAAGIDFIDITFGFDVPEGPVPDDFPLSPVTYSGSLIKQAVRIPVIGVYGLRSQSDIELLLEREYADIAGAARAILADPHFAQHVLTGQAVNSCCACKDCFWFTDHTKCPARLRTT